MSLTVSEDSAQVRFHHPDGQANATRALDDLLSSATEGVKAAVCFITLPGAKLLARHAQKLKLANSYFVASIDPPTELESLLYLYRFSPKRIYIHLGGVTPEEIRVGRALMHSKVLLAEDVNKARLWVGSHNMTARAIAGANFEAGIEIAAPKTHSAIQDAALHVEACRATAELFDPSQIRRYREIQKRRLPKPDEIVKKSLLVIHAEARANPTTAPFTAHARLVPIEFDDLLRVDRGVRLYLHPPGSLQPRQQINVRNAELWEGSITAVVRTERHPKNKGLRGRFDAADFDLDVSNLDAPPVLVRAGESSIQPLTQGVIRVTRRGDVGKEAYSIGSEAPYINMLDSGDAVLHLHEVERDMLRFFTEASHDGQHLLYRPVRGMKQALRITGYEESARSALPEKWTDESSAPLLEAAAYELREAEHPVGSFFFKANYVIRPQEEEGHGHDLV